MQIQMEQASNNLFLMKDRALLVELVEFTKMQADTKYKTR
jgi:hypothetical protein